MLLTERSAEFDAALEEYAALLIREGVRLRRNQRLVINAPVECAAFARRCAGEAYAAGCEEVLMRWSDDALRRMRYLSGGDRAFDRSDPWDKLFFDGVSAEGAGWLSLSGGDPENLKGVSPDRLRRGVRAEGEAMRLFRRREARNEFPWCVCAVPTAAWAGAVFPTLSPPEAMSRLWEEVLRASRVIGDGADAAARWRAHSETLRNRVETLNRLRLRRLHYRNALGTDLTVELPEGHYWAGGPERCVTSGVMFSANIPTEEVFTLPKRDGVNGVVCASRPIVYQGTVIQGARFTISGGKIIRAEADSGEEVLRDAVSVDEGAAYLGEAALVPWDSPISRSGILFYHTLLDENAACHFAFGDSYPCIDGAEAMTPEELLAAGANHSLVHVDFMVGTADLSITGVAGDGAAVQVFRDGNFAW